MGQTIDRFPSANHHLPPAIAGDAPHGLDVPGLSPLLLFGDHELPPLAVPMEDEGYVRPLHHAQAHHRHDDDRPGNGPVREDIPLQVPAAAHDHGQHWERGPRDWSAPSDSGQEPVTLALSTSSLRWAMPTLSNPTVINLNNTGGTTFWSFGQDQDVIFIGADAVRTASRLQTQGGRNIVVLGGHYQPSGSATATLAFYGVSGSVYVDGVHIDNVNSFGKDGIAISGAVGTSPDLYVQNSRIVNIGGSTSAHADIIQTQGPVGDLHVYNLTGTTSYQGLFISPQSPTHYAYLENVNLSYTNPNSTSISYLYWFLDGTNQKAYGIDLKNVYAVPRANQAADLYTVWPKSTEDRSIAGVAQGGGVAWPTLPYHGSVIIGAPGTDFAPAAAVGLNYEWGTINGNVVTQAGAIAPPPELGPIAIADSYAANVGGTLNVATPAGLLVNDIDGNGDGLSVKAFGGSTARGGTVNVFGDGHFNYTAPVGFSGIDSFTYTVADGRGGIDVVEVKLTVGSGSAPNLAPMVEASRSLSTTAGVAVDLGIKAPVDADANALIIRVTALPQAAAGRVELPDGTALGLNHVLSLGQLAALKFVPAAGYTGTAAFAYAVSDGVFQPVTGTVSVTVGGSPGPVNQPPQVEADRTVILAEDSAPVGLGISQLPSDPNNDPLVLTVTAVPSASLGVVTLADGITALAQGQILDRNDLAGLLFKPAANANGTATFTYKGADGKGGEDSQTITFNITPVNDAPTVEANKLLTDRAGQTINLNIAAPTDVDGDSLIIRVSELPSSGSVLLTNGAAVTVNQQLTLSQLSSLRYRAASSGSGDVGDFRYSVNDGHGGLVYGDIDLYVIGNPIRTQAESMQLNGYGTAFVSGASGSRDIRLTAPTGTATTTFNGKAGTYDIRIGYYDTDNGSAQLAVRVNGTQIDSWTLNADTNTSSPNSRSFALHTAATQVQLAPGTQIQIVGTRGGSDRAQVDYMEFVPTAPPAPLASASDQLSFS